MPATIGSPRGGSDRGVTTPGFGAAAARAGDQSSSWGRRRRPRAGTTTERRRGHYRRWGGTDRGPAEHRGGAGLRGHPGARRHRLPAARHRPIRAQRRQPPGVACRRGEGRRPAPGHAPDLYLPGWYQYLAQVAAGLTPWAVVTDRELERRAILEAPDVAETRGPGTRAGFAEHFDRVPVMLVLLADLARLSTVDRDCGHYTMVGGASIYPFAWSILLAARAEGLAGVMTTMVVREENAVKELLGVPDTVSVVGVLALGRAGPATDEAAAGPVELLRHRRPVRRRSVGRGVTRRRGRPRRSEGRAVKVRIGVGMGGGIRRSGRRVSRGWSTTSTSSGSTRSGCPRCSPHRRWTPWSASGLRRRPQSPAQAGHHHAPPRPQPGAGGQGAGHPRRPVRGAGCWSPSCPGCPAHPEAGAVGVAGPDKAGADGRDAARCSAGSGPGTPVSHHGPAGDFDERDAGSRSRSSSHSSSGPVAWSPPPSGAAAGSPTDGCPRPAPRPRWRRPGWSSTSSAAEAGRVISPEHFGVSIAYASEPLVPAVPPGPRVVPAGGRPGPGGPGGDRRAPVDVRGSSWTWGSPSSWSVPWPIPDRGGPSSSPWPPASSTSRRDPEPSRPIRIRGPRRSPN